jgi:ferritin-like protein
MAAASGSLHEDPKQLKAETIDRHRAIMSLMEELEAVDWYDQRVDAASDPELRAILAHNRDEEKEHASMLLEWIRRHDPAFGRELRSYLFREGPIVEAEHGEAAAPAMQGNGGLLSIGSLREEAAR